MDNKQDKKEAKVVAQGHLNNLKVSTTQKQRGYPYHTTISNRRAKPGAQVNIRLVGPALPQVGEIIQFESLTMKITGYTEKERPAMGKHPINGVKTAMLKCEVVFNHFFPELIDRLVKQIGTIAA